MKRRAIITLGIFFALIVALCLTVLLIYNSKWAKSKNEDKFFTSYHLIELTDEDKEYYSDYTWELSYDQRFNEFEINVSELTGALEVRVYSFKNLQVDNRPDDLEGLFNIGEELMSFELDETGRYRYSLDEDVSDYLVYCGLTPGSKYSKLSISTWSWLNNWEGMLDDLGIDTDKKVTVESLKSNAR